MSVQMKALLAGLGLCVAISPAQGAEATGSSMQQLGLGQYRADEPYQYQEAVRRSLYIPARDGVRLAIDYYLPAKNSRAVSGKFPSMLQITRYGRATPVAGGGTVRWAVAPADAHGLLKLPGDRYGSDSSMASGPLLMLAYGYAVVIADMRGAGASFGVSVDEGDAIEGRDGADIVTWIAKQPWSDKAVGMFGSSYLAEIQPRTAAERPKALKALSMMFGFFDGENGAYSMGGVFRAGWMDAWTAKVIQLDNRAEKPKGPITNIAPVDSDPEQKLLREAVAEHRYGADAVDDLAAGLEDFKTVGVLRDRIKFIDQYQESGRNNLHNIVGRVNNSAIPTLLFGGWYDLYTNDTLYWYANLKVPRKMILGPYAHNDMGPIPNDPRNADLARISARETLRWFDRWLRNVPNGAEDRASVHYGVQQSRHRTEWYTSPGWPPKDASYQTLALSADVAGAVRSQNDGSLSLTPGNAISRQPWVVDYTTSLGNTGTRWQFKKVMEIDMTANDIKSMTYTSPPLRHDLIVAGVPIVRLLLSSENAKDADVYAYLTAVDEQGYSHLVSEGILRASHRTLGKAPYDNFGLPFPTSDSKDVLNAPPLSATPVRLEFALYAVGRVFRAGERLRLTISGADKGNTVTLEQDPAPRLGIHVGGSSGAGLSLPILGGALEGAFR